MRFTCLALSIVCVLACRKSPRRGGGSAAGSAATVQAGGVVGSGSGSAASSGSAAPAATAFDDTLVLPTQPERAKDDQARVNGAAQALRTALTEAKTASDSATLCKAFGPLKDAMKQLQLVSAPAGNEQDFSSQ